MTTAKLERLLSCSGLSFHWSDLTSSWWFTTANDSARQNDTMRGRPAADRDAAEAAAVRLLEDLNLPESNPSHETISLEKLLNKYRLTFNWANPGLNWWLVGQNKGSNALRRTTPRPSKDLQEARDHAVLYILNNFQPTLGIEG